MAGIGATLAVGVKTEAAASAVTSRLLTVVSVSIQHWAAMGKHLEQARVIGLLKKQIVGPLKH